MEDTRREILRKAFATVAPAAVLSGCAGYEQEEGLEQHYIDTDLDKLHSEVNGEDIHVNLLAYAEDESLEEMELQYREPGGEAWEYLDGEEVEGDEVQISESFHGEKEGEYEFRSVVRSEDQTYVSEVEDVEFI